MRPRVGGSSVVQKRPCRRPLSPSEADRPAAPWPGHPADRPRRRRQPCASYVATCLACSDLPKGKGLLGTQIETDRASVEPTGTRRDPRWATRVRTRGFSPAQPVSAPSGHSSPRAQRPARRRTCVLGRRAPLARSCWLLPHPKPQDPLGVTPPAPPSALHARTSRPKGAS